MTDRKNLHDKNTCGQRLTKILMAQYRNFVEDPHPHLLCAVEEDIREWYFLVGGLDAPFLHGEYIFKLTAPDDFPQKPPRFEFYTTNGVFQPGGPICISVGEFHADDRPGKDGSHGWRPSLGMKGFAIQVVNGLICHEGLERGVRIQIVPDPMKIACAKLSRSRNQRNLPKIYQVFEALIASSPESEPVLNIADARLRLEGKTPPRLPAAPAAAAPAVAVPPRVDNLAASDAGDSFLDELLGEDDPLASLLNDEVRSSEGLTPPASHTAEIAAATAEPTEPAAAEENDSATQATGPDQDGEMDSLLDD